MASKDTERDEHLKHIATGGRRGKLPDLEDEEIVTPQELFGDAGNPVPTNKPIPRLHVVDDKGKVRAFMHHHIDSGRCEFSHDGFTLVFAATKLWEIVVKGRQMFRRYDYCLLGRWKVLRPDHRADFKEGEAVESITVTDITPRDHPQQSLQGGGQNEQAIER